MDSRAWFEYLDGSRLGAKVRDIIADERNRFYIHVVSLAEIVSKEKRRNKDPETAWKAITNLTKILQIDELDSKEVGYLHAEMKSKNKNFGLADSFVLYAARKMGGRVLSGDPDFKGVSDVILIA
ncbi:MAG: PIN domain-containing protein [Nitrososphaerales archaeon]